MLILLSVILSAVTLGLLVLVALHFRREMEAVHRQLAAVGAGQSERFAPSEEAPEMKPEVSGPTSVHQEDTGPEVAPPTEFHHSHIEPEADIPPPTRSVEIEAFLRGLDAFKGKDKRYLETHLVRLVRTLTLVPPPQLTGCALELGTYMHVAPVLARVFKYREVRGAYAGRKGQFDICQATSDGQELLTCRVDLFDAESDRFPYPDERFDLVLACELLEHLIHDPMHMMLEIRRTLVEGGALLLTTPNTSSYTSVAKVLEGEDNPQLFAYYPLLKTELPHVREYTPKELRTLLESAGYEVEFLFTERLPGCNAHSGIQRLLEEHGYPTSLRGEQIYCLARRRSHLPVIRHPDFLYEERTPEELA